MEINKIIYETCRNVINLEDKLSIATLFLFCEKLGTKKLSELLYNENIEEFIDDIQKEYENFDVDFTIRLDKREVKDAFLDTIEKYKQKNDASGFLKAVFEKDPYALAICNVSDFYEEKIGFYK